MKLIIETLLSLFLLTNLNAAVLLNNNAIYVNTTIPSNEEFVSDFELPLTLDGEEFALSFLVLGEFTEPGLNFIAEYNDGSHMHNMITVTNKTLFDIDQIAFIPLAEVSSFNFGWEKDNHGLQFISSLTWQHKGDQWTASAFNFDRTTIPEPSGAILLLLSCVILCRRHVNKSRSLSFSDFVCAKQKGIAGIN